MEHPLARMSTQLTDMEDTTKTATMPMPMSSRASQSGPAPLPSMTVLVNDFESRQELVRLANKQKREANEERKRLQAELKKRSGDAEDPNKPQPERGVVDDVIADVRDDVRSKKPDWKDEALETIPKFSCVEDNVMTVEEWCASALRLTDQFAGSDVMKIRALRNVIPISDLRAPEVDLTKFSVVSFLSKVITIWKTSVGNTAVKAVLVRQRGVTWIDFRRQLITWAAKHGTTISDEWLIAQMRANTQLQRDALGAAMVDSETWARVMDRTESMYNHAERDVQESRSIGSIEVEPLDDQAEPVNAIRKNGRGGRKQHQFTSDGKPICDRCHRVGHTSRNCQPRWKRKLQSRFVYSIWDDDCVPLVVSMQVCGQEINAMLDCGAMENVMDVRTLRRIIPSITLKPFPKQLIGADKKPIDVVGATQLPLKINGSTKQINCVAVRNLNTDLIIGLPGLKQLEVVADFHTGQIRMGSSVICAIGFAEASSGIKSTMDYNIDENLDETKRQQMEAVIRKWADTLVETIQDRGPAKGYRFSIDTGDTKPIYVPLRTYSPKEQEELDRQIEEMLEKHIITRVRSPWSAPVLLVKKKDSTYRVVVDYTRLNAKTVDDPYPLPIPKMAFQELDNACYYSSLDLASGYWQVALAKKDVLKTAFNTRKGTFAYLRMPMGLKGAPTAFQRFMTEIFSDLLYRGVLVFIDDILIYSATWEEHLALVDKVLRRLSQHNLQAKVGKCHFGAKEIKYLGSVISYRHRKPDPDKVKAIKEMEAPKSKEDVRSVLGLASFYREFIPNLAQIAEPIQELMKKDVQFQWGPDQEKAFETIKNSISAESCLEIPDPKWKYELHTDASLKGIGAVLFQRDSDGKLHTIEFASKSLSRAQRKQAIPVLECYAIIWALKKFRCYIHGVHVDIYTDHYGLQFMKQKKDPPAQIQRWWWDIADYDFDIFYKKGKKNIADPLSRLMPLSQLDDEDEQDMALIAAISCVVHAHNKVVQILERRMRGLRREYLVVWNSPTGPKSWETKHAIRNSSLVERFDEQWENRQRELEQQALDKTRREMSREEVLKEQKLDPECCAIYDALAGKPVSQVVKNDADQCIIVDGTLYHKDIRRKSLDGQLQLVIPKSFRIRLVEEIHGGVFGGHFGVDRTLDTVRRHYWWHGMKNDVKMVVKGCPKCGARNPVRGATKPLLQQEERTAVPWERVGIDYTDMAKSNEGYSKILVMIDHATKFVIAKPTMDGSAETAAKILFEDLICKYGSPKELWSDRGKPFIGEIAQFLTGLYQIKQKFTSGYHPQTNGLTERFNRTIADELAKAVDDTKSDWPARLQPKVFAYNTSVQKSTGHSPFELIHTFTPRTPIDNELVEPSANFKKKDWAEEAYRIAQEMRNDALKNQQTAAKYQKSSYDKGLKPENFQIGDYVRVYDHTAEAKLPVKLRNQYIGPFRIRGRKGMLFELEDRRGARLKGLYHPSKLKNANAEIELENIL